MERNLGKSYRAVIWITECSVVYDLWKGRVLVVCGYAIGGTEETALEHCRELVE